MHASDIPMQSGVSVDGELVARVDADRISLGANGDVFASVPLVDDALDLRFPLGGASAALQAGGALAEVDLFLAGSLSGDESLPGWLPIELTDQGRIDASARLVYRSFGPRLLGEASFVDISGSVDLGGSFLTGVRLTGRTTTQLLPLVGVGSELTLDAFISPVNLGASFVDLRGTIGVADAPLGADALIRLDGTGIRAGGVVELSPNNRVGVEEAITSREVSLSGDLTLSVRTGEIFGFLDGVGGAAGDARAEIARLERLAQVGIAEGAEAIDGILSFDARVQADLSVTIGTDGISGRVTGSVCNGDGCLELVGGSVTFAPTPEACFSAGPATGCLRL